MYKPVVLLISLFIFSAVDGQNKFDILVFTGTTGFYHKSNPDAQQAVIALGQKNNFVVDTSTDPAIFLQEKLDKYKVIVFLSTGGEDLLNPMQEKSFEKYIANGGNFVGIHGASATEYNWEWFGKLVGAFFDNHPKIQQGVINVINKDHPSTKHLPDQWVWTDEWYNWRKPLPDGYTVLATVDESTYEGGEMGDFHPIIWCHQTRDSRSWYTALGHKSEHYNDDDFLQHILGGILWAAGIEN